MSSQIDSCPICLDKLDNTKIIINTPCKHKFCVGCFLDLYETKCPMCRNDLKKFLPDKLLNIFLINNKNEKPKTSTNIFNLREFPPLS